VFLSLNIFLFRVIDSEFGKRFVILPFNLIAESGFERRMAECGRAK